MSEVTLQIDGKEVKTEKGKTILETAEKAGIHIPTLCYYPGLSPAGVCRLCSVEITQRGRKRLVTACCYPAEEELVVNTKSQEVIETRKMIIQLMLARCPNVRIVQDLAREYQVEKPKFKLEDEKCILCGLCERVCSKIGKSVINFVGRGVNRVVKTPYQISSDADLDFCMSCGSCVSVCPTEAMEAVFKEITRKKPIPIPSEFDMGLTSRKPVYLPFLQSVPNVPAIDREKCAHFATGECGICKELCDTNAIDFEQKEELIELEVGAIVVATGFDLFDPSKLPEYGYGRYKNVITAMEFERLASASGPTKGEIIRPSDKHHPKRIAFIQCVGSRDLSRGQAYCSSVCCMHATKEALLAKEHDPEVQALIFYNDLRAFGKGFNEFVTRAQFEYGVQYIRALPGEIQEAPDTKNLTIWFDETSTRKLMKLEVDLVVLSTALIPREDNKTLAKIFGVELNEYGFFKPSDLLGAPLDTHMKGVFICGCCQEPKDIPDSVANASGTAARVSEVVASLGRKK